MIEIFWINFKLLVQYLLHSKLKKDIRELLTTIIYSMKVLKNMHAMSTF
jgi:hypothetical protein